MSELIVSNPLTVLRYVSGREHYVGRWAIPARRDERPTIAEVARSLRIVADLCLTVDKLRTQSGRPPFDLHAKGLSEYAHGETAKHQVRVIEAPLIVDRSATTKPPGAFLSQFLATSPEIANFEEEIDPDFPGIPAERVEQLRLRMDEVLSELGGVTGSARPIARELQRYIREDVVPLVAASQEHEMWFLVPELADNVRDRLFSTSLSLQLSGEARVAFLVLNLMVTFLGVAVPPISLAMGVTAALLAAGDAAGLANKIGESLTSVDAMPPQLEAGGSSDDEAKSHPE